MTGSCRGQQQVTERQAGGTLPDTLARTVRPGQLQPRYTQKGDGCGGRVGEVLVVRYGVKGCCLWGWGGGLLVVRQGVEGCWFWGGVGRMLVVGKG